MSAETLPMPAAPAVAVVPAKKDFADWLSPMLVKELRQGLRARGFVSTFILLQVVMAVTVIIGLVTGAEGIDPRAASGFFWFFVGLPLLLIVPMMALNSLSGEIKANTLELIFLTRLTAWRIVVGKWLALVAQSALFVCAILPYAVLRYFIGGINLVEELTTLAWMLAASALFTGITTGLSPYSSRLVRGILIFVFIMALQGGVPFIFFGGMAFGGGGFGFEPAVQAALTGFGVVLLLLMFEAGAGKIAPPAENHSSRKRLLGLVLLGGAALGSWLAPGEAEFIALVALTLAVLVCAEALCEPSRWIPSIFAPFAKRGAAGRAVGRILYPGWSSGLLFTLVILSGFALLLWKLDMFSDEEPIIGYVALCGALFFPVALIRAFLKNEEKAFGYFLALQALFIALAVVCAILRSALEWQTGWVASLIPSTALALVMTDSLKGLNSHWEAYLYLCSATTGLSLLYLLVRGPWRKMREMEQESLKLSPPNGPLA